MAIILAAVFLAAIGTSATVFLYPEKAKSAPLPLVRAKNFLSFFFGSGHLPSIPWRWRKMGSICNSRREMHSP